MNEFFLPTYWRLEPMYFLKAFCIKKKKKDTKTVYTNS